jgi:exodeoxyribonuclease V alpha subunit
MLDDTFPSELTYIKKIRHIKIIELLFFIIQVKDFEHGSGVFNGDIGIIDFIDSNQLEIVVLFEDGRRAIYNKADISELVLSYAITIHKSQGSEFDVIIIPITSGPPMLLTRNLLYTAVTRAKRMVVLIGNLSVIRRMVKNNYTTTRYSLLKDFLIESLNETEKFLNNIETKE